MYNKDIPLNYFQTKYYIYQYYIFVIADTSKDRMFS